MKAAVPLMVTVKMRQDLRAQGFDVAAIDGMNPQEAWERLGGTPVQPTETNSEAVCPLTEAEKREYMRELGRLNERDLQASWESETDEIQRLIDATTDARPDRRGIY